ncbi:hypothetical protein V0R37_12320 [Pollutimonas sp. H1-120]|uniref:hypothetical protein n=1 Tax=Pollutimonas sp. H1-120 TaxID=3148824 RepID=UPI003B5192A3
MATPSVNPTRPSASDELNSLLQTLHEQGLLRLANDLAASYSQWVPTLCEIIDESPDVERLRHAIPALIETAGLLQSLHQQGLLRFANDVVASQDQWMPVLSEILDDYRNDESIRKALQNMLVICTTMLSRIEPDQLSKLLLALSDSLEHIAKRKPNGNEAAAPGLVGLYRMTKDESLWRGLAPVIEMLKVFSTKLDAATDRAV